MMSLSGNSRFNVAEGHIGELAFLSRPEIISELDGGSDQFSGADARWESVRGESYTLWRVNTLQSALGKGLRVVFT